MSKKSKKIIVHTIKNEKRANAQFIIKKLRDKLVPCTKVSNEKVEILVTTEEYVSNAYEVIAEALSGYAFESELLKGVNGNNFEIGTNKKILEKAMSYYKDSSYWKVLTSVELAIFFENHNELNFKSFVNFNLSGFKREVKLFVKEIMKREERAIKESDGSSTMNDEELLNERSKGVTVDVRQVIEKMREAIETSNLSNNFFDTIHLKKHGNIFALYSKTGERLDEHFIKDNLGVIIQVKQSEVEIDNLIFEVVLLLSIFHAFQPKKAIVHKSIDTELKETLKGNIEEVRQSYEKPMNIKVVECEINCPNCDKDE